MEEKNYNKPWRKLGRLGKKCKESKSEKGVPGKPNTPENEPGLCEPIITASEIQKSGKEIYIECTPGEHAPREAKEESQNEALAIAKA